MRSSSTAQQCTAALILCLCTFCSSGKCLAQEQGNIIAAPQASPQQPTPQPEMQQQATPMPEMQQQAMPQQMQQQQAMPQTMPQAECSCTCDCGDASCPGVCDQCAQRGRVGGGFFSNLLKNGSCDDGTCGGCNKCRLAGFKRNFGGGPVSCDGSCGGNCVECAPQQVYEDVSCGCSKCRLGKQRNATTQISCDGSCGGNCDECYTRRTRPKASKWGQGIPAGPAKGMTIFSKGSKTCRSGNCGNDSVFTKLFGSRLASNDCDCAECQSGGMTRFTSTETGCDGSCGGGCDSCQRQGLMARFGGQGGACDGRCGGGCDSCQRQGLMARFSSGSCDGQGGGDCDSCDNGGSSNGGLFARFTDRIGSQNCGGAGCDDGCCGCNSGGMGLNSGGMGLGGGGGLLGRRAAGCGRGGCGTGGRLCRSCQGLAGEIPHTAQPPYPGFGSQAPTYAYPYYTTRGPRDFLQDACGPGPIMPYSPRTTCLPSIGY